MAELQDPIDEQLAILRSQGLMFSQIAVELGICLQTTYKRWRNPQVRVRTKELTQIVLTSMKVEAESVIQAVTDIAFDVNESTNTRLDALKTLGKNLGVFSDKLTLEGGTNPIQVQVGISPSLRGLLDAVYKQAAGKQLL